MTFTFENISIRIGNSLIVKDASSTLERGKVTAVIGPNGAGKSTLLTALAGLRPYSGSVVTFGKAISVNEQRVKVAYMPQDIAAQSSLTALEVVLMGKLNSLGLSVPRELITAAEEALENFGLLDLQGRSLHEVSGGQRQLIYLTQALFRKPELLLLDEPTASLDLRHQLMVLESVRSFIVRHNIAVAIAIHDISLAAQFADQIICMCEGKIDISDQTDEVLQPNRLRRIFGVDVEVERSNAGHLRITPLKAI